MDVLLIIGIILLLSANVLLITILIVGFKFVRDLKFLLSSVQHEADQFKIDFARLQNRLSSAKSWLPLIIDLLGKRHAIKKIAERLVK